MAGVAARTVEERVAAQIVLADTPLADFLKEELIPYEEDEVTRVNFDRRDPLAFMPISSLTVGEFREWILSDLVSGDDIKAISEGILPEMAAAVSKIMRNQDLIRAAAKIRHVTSFRSTIGLPGCLSVRLQPNDPTDDPKGIAAQIIV